MIPEDMDFGAWLFPDGGLETLLEGARPLRLKHL